MGTGGGLALAGLLGLKAALFGGVLIGAAASRRRTKTHYRPSRKSYSRSYKTHKYRYGRSIEDEEIIDEHEALSNAILDASLNDGIGKRLMFVNDLFIFSRMAMMIFMSFTAF